MAAPDFLRADEAARQFSVHRDTLARWAKRGLIGRSKVDSTVWYRAQDIADQLLTHETPRKVVPAQSTATPKRETPAWVTEFWADPPAPSAGRSRVAAR